MVFLEDNVQLSTADQACLTELASITQEERDRPSSSTTAPDPPGDASTPEPRVVRRLRINNSDRWAAQASNRPKGVTERDWEAAQVFTRPCVDCGMRTGSYCDFCFAQDRIPDEPWNSPIQGTPSPT